MFVGNCFSNKSNLDIYTSNESPLRKRNFYNETTTKKKSGDNFNNINISNSLIDALRNFSVKYELEDKIILKDYKFVISFDDLIYILSYCLKSQKKLYEIEQEDSSIISNLINSFINNISNYIYSYEKVEKINPLSNNINKIKSPSNKENISFNSNKINNKKPIRIIKSSSCWANIKKTKINSKKNKEKLKNNYHTNLKFNKSINNTKNPKANLSKNENNNTNKTDEKNYTKTFFMRKKYKNLSTIFSPVKNPQNKNSIIKVMKARNNKSAEKRRIKSQYNDYFKNNQKEISKTNKSMEKREGNKSDNKNESKNISIYSACEYIKSSSFLLKNKNKELNNESKIENKSSFNSSHSINLMNKNDKNKKVVYYNENMNLGIKKKIIRGSMPRPSNLANKLLAKGIQFITDFNGLKEEEKRKSLNKYH